MTNQNETIIHTNALSKTFGKVRVLDSVDLRVPRHAIFGFLGPNGAGKSTTMKILLGLIKPTSGSGTIFGHDIVAESMMARARIGYLPQQPRFIDYMNALELLQFAAGFYPGHSPKKTTTRSKELLELVGLADKMTQSVKGFSGGEKQRLGIAIAQIHQPDLLILDEPAAALDPLGRLQVLEIMERLRESTTIFYSTHILDDVQRVSDTVAILNQGRLVAQGPIETLLNGNSDVVYSFSVKNTGIQIAERLQTCAWISEISSIHRNGTVVYQVCVSDPQKAETLLLRKLLEDEQVIVTGFERKKHDLEEVFMDLVKGEGNAQA